MNKDLALDKKRLMFISGEDFYFFAYSLFILLDCMGSKNGKFFKDHRKLAFLIPILADSKVIGIFERSEASEVKNVEDISLLRNLYSDGVSRQGEITKLLLMLEKKGYLVLKKGSSSGVIDISMKGSVFGSKGISKTKFSEEINNCKSIKKVFPRTTIILLESLLYKMFDERGVKRWAF